MCVCVRLVLEVVTPVCREKYAYSVVVNSVCVCVCVGMCVCVRLVLEVVTTVCREICIFSGC